MRRRFTPLGHEVGEERGLDFFESYREKMGVFTALRKAQNVKFACGFDYHMRAIANLNDNSFLVE